MARKKTGYAMADQLEDILRSRPATTQELAKALYGDDTLYYQRCVQDMICRLRLRRGVRVIRQNVYRIG